MSNSLTSDDFVTGILSALALDGDRRTLDRVDHDFDEAMADAYRHLVDLQPEHLNVAFQVEPDRIHGDSVVIQDALTVAISGRIVRRLNPSFRKVEIVVAQERAQRLLSDLPGGADLYRELADRFWSRYCDSVHV